MSPRVGGVEADPRTHPGFDCSRPTHVQDDGQQLGAIHPVSRVLLAGPDPLVALLQGQGDPAEEPVLPRAHGRLRTRSFGFHRFEEPFPLYYPDVPFLVRN